MVNWFNFYRSSTFQAFCRTSSFVNRTINKDIMVFCLTYFIVCVSTTLSLKLQSKNAGTYIFIVFIYKSPCKILIYWLIFKLQSSTFCQETGLWQTKCNDINISWYLIGWYRYQKSINDPSSKYYEHDKWFYQYGKSLLWC